MDAPYEQPYEICGRESPMEDGSTGATRYATGVSETPRLLLSPHLDDAVFSASYILDLPFAEVWTVFAGIPEDDVKTEWDERCGYTSGASLMRDRRQEDAAALRDCTFRQLGLLERAYVSRGRRAEDMQVLARMIREWLAQHPDGILVIPVGAGVRMKRSIIEVLQTHIERYVPYAKPAGGSSEETSFNREEPSSLASVPKEQPPLPHRLLRHIKRGAQSALHRNYLRRRRSAQRKGMLANEDHLEVRDLAVGIVKEMNCEVWAYEDMPYAWSYPGDFAARELAITLNRRASMVTHRPDRRLKFTRIQNYRTQLEVMDPMHRRLEKMATIPYPERYWRYLPEYSVI